MFHHHLVRFGALANVGRFAAVDATVFPRHSRVVLRTSRGLELGEVLAPPDGVDDGDVVDDSEEHALARLNTGQVVESPVGDGSILRGVTPQDDLLAARIEKHRLAAFMACERRIQQLGLPVALMDVEHLFDGRSLWFYFLGEITPEVAALTAELTELYETKVQFRRFAETLSAGCGPSCGTADASGGGCQSCGSGCAVAGACGTKKDRKPLAM
jgi:cell fate regulator YaaT (PSP1 superfamily)